MHCNCRVHVLQLLRLARNQTAHSGPKIQSPSRPVPGDESRDGLDVLDQGGREINNQVLGHLQHAPRKQ